MKKIIILLISLNLLTINNSCGKAHFNPIETYTLQGTNDKWVFSKNDFGIDLHRPYNKPYWYRCEKIGTDKKGTISFDNTLSDNVLFTYEVKGNIITLIGNNDKGFVFNYVLIYDRTKQNFPGIFQK